MKLSQSVMKKPSCPICKGPGCAFVRIRLKLSSSTAGSGCFLHRRSHELGTHLKKHLIKRHNHPGTVFCTDIQRMFAEIRFGDTIDAISSTVLLEFIEYANLHA